MGNKLYTQKQPTPAPVKEPVVQEEQQQEQLDAQQAPADTATANEATEQSGDTSEQPAESEDTQAPEQTQEEAPAAPAQSPEQSAVAEPTPAPAVAETTQALVQAAESASTRFGGVSDSVKVVLSTLEEYVTKMRPGHMVGDREGAIQQQRLYRTLKTAMALPDVKDFRAAMDAIMETIAQHRNGCFGEYHVYRFVENVQLSSDDRKEFERLMHLLITLAPAGDRAAILNAQLDLNVILVNVKQEEVKQRFLAYLRRFCGIN